MYDKRDKIKAGGKTYTVIRNLGMNQDAGIYLVTGNNKMFLLKDFSEGNTNASEIVKNAVKAYNVLKGTGIKLQKLENYDIDRGILVKEYFFGEPAASLIMANRISASTVAAIYRMSKKVEDSGLVLDYFPTNFIVKEDEPYYVIYDYEEKTVENNFDNKGVRYWLNTSNLCHLLMAGGR